MATGEVTTPSFREQTKGVPDEPGVYVFRDEDDIVLYVGKATSLRKRVASYLKRDPLDRKTRDLVPRIARVEWVVADSETEALLLEQNFIKRYRPLFNVRLRDDKSYPYIAVTVEEDYPRVLFTRERHRRGVLYFGPYSSAHKVRTTLETLNKIFPYRPCEGPTPGRRSGIPCLDYHLGRCAAPCVGLHLQGGLPQGHRRRDRVPVGAGRRRWSAISSAACGRPPSDSSSRTPPGSATA